MLFQQCLQKLHFIWLGKLLPFKYIRNILTFVRKKLHLKPTFQFLFSPLFSSRSNFYTDNKNQIFPIYKEIQKGAVAKTYMTNSLLIYG
jgi:hypothetical protein